MSLSNWGMLASLLLGFVSIGLGFYFNTPNPNQVLLILSGWVAALLVTLSLLPIVVILERRNQNLNDAIVELKEDNVYAKERCREERNISTTLSHIISDRLGLEVKATPRETERNGRSNNERT